jgi:hypothetical protein
MRKSVGDWARMRRNTVGACRALSTMWLPTITLPPISRRWRADLANFSVILSAAVSVVLGKIAVFLCYGMISVKIENVAPDHRMV